MKKTIITGILALSLAGVWASAPEGVEVGKFRAERNGDFMAVGMNLGLSGLDVSTNRCVLLTPVLANGSDSVALPSVAVYGRRRYYYYKRNEGSSMLSGSDEMTLRAKKLPEAVDYSQLLP